jgi:hypothetical protein
LENRFFAKKTRFFKKVRFLYKKVHFFITFSPNLGKSEILAFFFEKVVKFWFAKWKIWRQHRFPGVRQDPARTPGSSGSGLLSENPGILARLAGQPGQIWQASLPDLGSWDEGLGLATTYLDICWLVLAVGRYDPTHLGRSIAMALRCLIRLVV